MTVNIITLNNIPLPTTPRFQNLINQQFQRLTVIAFAEISASGQTRWLCKCQCGKQKIVSASKLKNGNTSSCGCLRIEVTRIRNLKHGQATKKLHTSEYNIWIGIHTRCKKTTHPYYKDYGGRGITVCKRWDSFENFFADMGKKPLPKLSIDRIDNDKGYSPENCKWASFKQQARNRRGNRVVTFEGVTACLAEHCERLNLSVKYEQIRVRLAKGWSVKEAFSI